MFGTSHPGRSLRRGPERSYSRLLLFASAGWAFGLSARFARYPSFADVTTRYVPCNVPRRYNDGVAAPAKLSEADVKRIRRRVRAGEHQTELAVEFGVNRKTIRRRLDELERAETERAERIAEKRLRRQAAREKRKLFERERDAGVSPPIEPSQSSGRSAQKRTPVRNPYFDWLDK